MVSFHKGLAESPTAAVPPEFEALSKKRKWEMPFAEEFFNGQTRTEKRKSILDMELHLDTPLPSEEWQKGLSVQSGQIQFCNTRMNRKTPEEPNRSPEAPSSGHMSLDLELNLTCESVKKKEAGNFNINIEKQNSSYAASLGDHHDLFVESSKYMEDSSGGLTRSPSWLSFEGEHKEMVATVCMRCHMLVMLCKSSPACPNCKFMHPQDQNPSTFLK